jgi:hypothetical protein
MWFDNEASRGTITRGDWRDQPRIYTSADVRIVMKRKHPVTGQWVVCTEPSPDVAKALSTASQVALQGGTLKASGAASAAMSSAESALELAGRTTALLALRDGLYRTCEAYANGALGSDAYALVLARYGQLMTTLFLAQDIASAAASNNGTPASIVAPGPAVLPAPIAVPQLTPGSSAPGANAPPAAVASAPATASASAMASAPAAASAASSAPSSSAPAASSAPISIPASAVVAASIARMNEDYFDMDRNLLQLLVVSCINNYDTTRLPSEAVSTANQGLPFRGNYYLHPLCDRLTHLDVIRDIATSQAQLDQMSGHPGKPIDITAAIAVPAPVVTVVSSAPAPSATANTTTVSHIAVVTPTRAQIQFAQTVLISKGTTNIKKADGILGPDTVQALKQYQAAKQPKKIPTGHLDAATFMEILQDAETQLQTPAKATH